MEEMKTKAIDEIRRSIRQYHLTTAQPQKEQYYQRVQAKIHIVYKIGLLTTEDIETLYDELNA